MIACIERCEGVILRHGVGCDGKTRNVTISSRKHEDGRFQPQEDTLRVVLCNS